MAPSNSSDDTRDIVIETRSEVRSLVKTVETFIKDTQEERSRMLVRLEAHEALVQRGMGASWLGMGIIGLVTGWFGGHFPSLNKFFQ